MSDVQAGIALLQPDLPWKTIVVMALLENETSRFLEAWVQVRQLVQAANFNRFHRAGLSATQFYDSQCRAEGGAAPDRACSEAEFEPRFSKEDDRFVRRARNGFFGNPARPMPGRSIYSALERAGSFKIPRPESSTALWQVCFLLCRPRETGFDRWSRTTC